MKRDTALQQCDEQPAEDRAVSPVIGVILMVAITVILAAVIGTFVLDLGQNVGNTGPQASLAISDADDDYSPHFSGNVTLVEIKHDGGQELVGGQLKITVRNESSNSILTTYDAGTITQDAGQTASYYLLNGGVQNITASDSITTGDVLEIAIQNKSGSGAWNDGGTIDALGDRQNVIVTVIDTESSNQVGQATVEIK